ncbi:MAG: response regulator transcription factor [Elusimicrobiota bacterium]|nr:response regulator transcription factor [Elusimicrobiota bacterium]
MATILVVDDDRSVLDTVKKFLAASGYGVVLTDNGSEALLLARDTAPDAVLCDAEMPGMDGYELCRLLKKKAAGRPLPVVIMSGARVEEKDVVAGFDEGADDFVLKPFSLSVLLARLKAVMRRYDSSAAMDETLKRCGITLDPAGRTVRVGGAPVSLTRKEFDLLAALLGKSGRVLSVPYLLETVWGYDPADYNDAGTVEVHVSHLRKKLGARHAKHIVNVQGHGYKFSEDGL